jgi:hypothetical protein
MTTLVVVPTAKVEVTGKSFLLGCGRGKQEFIVVEKGELGFEAHLKWKDVTGSW